MSHDETLKAEIEKLGQKLEAMPEATRAKAETFLRGALCALEIIMGGDADA